jgi:hypothetical protein
MRSFEGGRNAHGAMPAAIHKLRDAHERHRKELLNEEGSAPLALRAGQWTMELVFVPEEESRKSGFLFSCFLHLPPLLLLLRQSSSSFHSPH